MVCRCPNIRVAHMCPTANGYAWNSKISNGIPRFPMELFSRRRARLGLQLGLEGFGKPQRKKLHLTWGIWILWDFPLGHEFGLTLKPTGYICDGRGMQKTQLEVIIRDHDEIRIIYSCYGYISHDVGDIYNRCIYFRETCFSPQQFYGAMKSLDFVRSILRSGLSADDIEQECTQLGVRSWEVSEKCKFKHGFYEKRNEISGDSHGRITLCS